LLDTELTISLLRILDLLLLLDGAHVDFAEVLRLIEVLIQGVRRVDGIKFLGRIFTGVLENNLRASGVF
jgi:hypothetical protein